jgi:hypothetical protein
MGNVISGKNDVISGNKTEEMALIPTINSIFY